jgi:hypothetical protein
LQKRIDPAGSILLKGLRNFPLVKTACERLAHGSAVERRQGIHHSRQLLVDTLVFYELIKRTAEQDKPEFGW